MWGRKRGVDEKGPGWKWLACLPAPEWKRCVTPRRGKSPNLASTSLVTRKQDEQHGGHRETAWPQELHLQVQNRVERLKLREVSRIVFLVVFMSDSKSSDSRYDMLLR